MLASQQRAPSHVTPYHHLIEALGRRHRCLDRQAANVLPSLLQQRDEVVDGQHDVGDELILSHANVSDSDTHAENLLQLELDGGLDLVDLARQILVVGDWGREFTSCRHVRDWIDMRRIAGSLPLERPGPNRRGICLMRVSEATKASYLRASFLINFLFLLSFFKSSEDMASIPPCLARSISC